MSTGFEKYSNYSESSSFSSVVFGAEKPLLEVELNELQQIINTKLSRIMKVLGTCVIPLSNDSITFDSSSKMVFISDCLILEKSGLTAYVGSAKVSDVLSAAKLNNLIKKEEEEKKPSKFVIIFAIIGIVVAVAAAIYGIYRFFTPDYLDDFEDDFEDEFDNDFFEDEDDEPAAATKNDTAEDAE